ncbi:MAG: hypothetical protein HN741_11300 [Anaerolineae bacterium]|jgi:hypothetical protein|nr:hypothetical protein [Anaerolineae bacterium]
MEFLDKITLKQATLYALIGTLIGFGAFLIELLDYFSFLMFAGAVGFGTLSLFLYKLYSKQKGE